MKKVVAFFLAVVSLAFAQTPQHTTVTATIADNPSLAIGSFSGSEAGRAALVAALKACGWFRMDEKAAKASVTVDVQYRESPAHQYFARVTAAGRQPLQLNAQNADVKQAAFELTDAILRQLFRVPALCTSKIAYALQGKDNKKEIFTCWLDGSGSARLSHNNAISTEPAWGHRGALVYTLAKNNALSIVLVDIKNNRQKIVSSSRGLNASAALSADGKSLALPLSMGGRVDLFVKDLQNGKLKRLTGDICVESSPCWSPDGKTLCFVSDKVGKPQLYLVPAVGGTATRLQLGGNECVSPDWSPVCNKLCYSMRSNAGQYVIALLDMTDRRANPEIITIATGDWEAPSWAPDGRHIVCTRALGRGRDLYVIDTWLKTFRQVTRGQGVSLPAWCPR